VHLVGFTIELNYDARSYKRKTPNYIYDSDFMTSFLFLFGSPKFHFYKHNVGKKITMSNL